MGGPYLVRRRSSGPNRYSAYLTVPNTIADAIPEGALFVPELHDDGILFRYVGQDTIPDAEVPAWAKKGGGNGTS